MNDILSLLRGDIPLDDKPNYLAREVKAWRFQVSVYKTVIDLLPVALFVFIQTNDDDFRYLIFRGRLVREAGYFPDLSEGNTLKKIMPPGLWRIVLPFYQAAVSGHYGHELKEMSTGNWYDIYYRPLRHGETMLGMIFATLGHPPANQGLFSSPLLRRLNDRQREIVTHLLDGESTGVIARSMGIKESTVQYHIGNIIKVLGVESRTEIVAVVNSYRNLQNS